MNLVTGQFKLNCEQMLDDVHDTFAREIKVWKTPEKTILSSNENYSFSYDNPEYNNDNSADLVEYIPISGSFMARVQYDNSLNKLFSNPQGSRAENFDITTDDGMVRLKVTSGDYHAFIKDAINIQFDNNSFRIFRTERPHGLFSPKYYTLYLKFEN